MQFADTKFWDDHTPALYQHIANEEGFKELDFNGSVKDYFKAQSYGQFEPDFDIAGPVTMPNGYACYGKPTNGQNDNNTALGEMVMDACKAVDESIDFTNYEWDGDGEVDQVFILYAGHGESGNYGMGNWNLMDQGSCNGDSYLPANYTSYERMYAGWIEPAELKGNCQIDNMKALAEIGEAYIIYNDKDEYYLLDNRQMSG